MVTHDPNSAARAQRTIEVFDGKIVSDQQTQQAPAIAI
jgi:putative ABC transport system ATP-binding protein